MKQKIKKIFSSLSKKEKFFLLPLFVLILIGIFCLVKTASASWVADLIIGFATSPFFFIAWVFVHIAILITILTGSLLNWVLSRDFIRFSYTNPAGPNANPIIETGLGVTQGFVNMLLVLVLVYIAIATILRLAGYETKKLLVTFIIVALLVNFAPVITGLIVDASNIIMNFFVQDLKADAFGKAMARKVSEIQAGYEFTAPWDTNVSRLFQFVIMTGFLLVLTFILLTFTLIFILRHLVIWVLVILSPLAFVCYILPATKKYFDQWWQQFLAWSFIGVTAGFFLYLGLLMVTYVPSAITSPNTDQGGLFNNVLPYFVSVVFLGIGLVFGLQTSAMGAGSVMSFAKAKGRVGVRDGWKAIKFTGAATAGAIRGVKEGKGIKGRIGGALKGAGTYEGREKGREVFGKILEKAHVVRPGAYETARRKRWKIEEETKRLESLPTDRLHEIVKRLPITPADRRGQVAAFEVLAKRSALKDEEKKKLPLIQSFGADTKQILKARPDWAEEMAKPEKKKVAIKEQTEGRSPKQFTQETQSEALKNIKVVISLDTAKIGHLGAHGTVEQKRTLKETIAPKSHTLNQILDRADELILQNTEETLKEANRIIDIVDEIRENPNIKSV